MQNMIPNTMKVKSSYTHETYDIRLVINRYMVDNSISIELMCDCKEFPGFYEPYATLTVYIDSNHTNENCAYIDTNNCDFAEKLIADYKLGKPTGKIVHSGFCTYPEYEFNMDALKKYEMEND